MIKSTPAGLIQKLLKSFHTIKVLLTTDFTKLNTNGRYNK